MPRGPEPEDGDGHRPDAHDRADRGETGDDRALTRQSKVLGPLSFPHARTSQGAKAWARFFRAQEHLKDLRVQQDLKAALNGAEAVIFAVPHEPYLKLKPEDVVKWAGKPLAVVDCFGILDDDAITRYFKLGCEVKALGRGHIQRLKDSVRRGTRRA